MGVLRCSAAHICHGCDTRMPQFLVAACLKCPWCQAFASQRESYIRASPQSLPLAAGPGLSTCPLNLTSLGQPRSKLQSLPMPSKVCLSGSRDMRCSSGQPGTAPAALCRQSLDPLHILPPPSTSHPQSTEYNRHAPPNKHIMVAELQPVVHP